MLCQRYSYVFLKLKIMLHKAIRCIIETIVLIILSLIFGVLAFIQIVSMGRFRPADKLAEGLHKFIALVYNDNDKVVK